MMLYIRGRYKETHLSCDREVLDYAHWRELMARAHETGLPGSWDDVFHAGELVGSMYHDHPIPKHSHEDSVLSYQDVEDRANQIADFATRVVGVKRGDVVALFMENRPEFITTWLGTPNINIYLPCSFCATPPVCDTLRLTAPDRRLPRRHYTCS